MTGTDRAEPWPSPPDTHLACGCRHLPISTRDLTGHITGCFNHPPGGWPYDDGQNTETQPDKD